MKKAMKRNALIILFLLGTQSILNISCNKDHEISQFYGKWQTSYGDVVEFSRSNSEDIITYNATMNLSMPMRKSYPYTYRNNKLGIKNGLNGPNNYYFFQSFRWIQQNKSFEIQGIQWFSFISSTQTYFTFTKM